ncbi:hypothetical protein AB0395_44970 [Streptosporangium sp. NPDC051023]|uniref:hypothetical protein n=1 Tax=Streptosporangium sp. NPDC051023 TaxID=3155410 RepID=UPI00344ED74E
MISPESRSGRPEPAGERSRRAAAPLLVIVGGRDALLDSQETRRRLERTVPHATVRFLPETGHLLREQSLPILGFLRVSEEGGHHA